MAVVPVFSTSKVVLSNNNNTFSITGGTGDQSGNPCEEMGGTLYDNRGQYTCCRNKMFNNTVDSDKFIIADECVGSLKEVDEDDIPTALYRKLLCHVKSSGATENDVKSLHNYVNYMTKDYGDKTIKSSILKNSQQCSGKNDTKKDDMKRFMNITRCFEETQSKVCQSQDNETITITLLNNRDYCKKYDLPENKYLQLCCKGKPIPFKVPSNVFSIAYRSDYRVDKVISCTESFEKRQKELESGRNNQTKSFDSKCSIACVARGGEYIKSPADLTFNMEDIKTFLFSIFSKNSRKELDIIFDEYAMDKIFLKPDNSTLSLKEAVKWMEGLDELSRITAYCRLYSFIGYQLEHAVVDQYCHGSKKNESEFAALSRDEQWALDRTRKFSYDL